MGDSGQWASALGSISRQRGKKDGASVSWALVSLVLEGQVPRPFRPASSLCLEDSARGKWAQCHPWGLGTVHI